MTTNPSPDRPTPRSAQAMPQAQQAMALQAEHVEDEHYEDEENYDDEAEHTKRFLLSAAVPSWLVSLFVNMAILIVMALITIEIKQETNVGTLEIGEEEETEELEEFEEEVPEEIDTELEVEDVEPIPESAEMETEMDISPANDLDAAQIAIDLNPLGELTAQRSDLARDIGAYTGTGLSGRGSAASRAGLVRRGGGTAGSEAAVAAALKWLAAHQRPDGSWNFDHRVGPCNGRCPNPGNLTASPNGATGLALLPFLGAGQTHRQGNYKDTVKNGLAFLLRRMKVQGGAGSLHEEGGTMYSHGICSIVLCEAYAMTQDKSLQMPAQMAINYIAVAQDPVGGGWRYEPKQAGDTSAVGWQLMALKSAHMAYLTVPPGVVPKASKFLDSVQTESGAKYGYTGPGTGTATTAIGLLSRMYLGWKHDHGALQNGVAFLDAQGPSHSNMYYNYYTTQIMRHYGGEEWERWNPKMRDWLVQTQSKDGHSAGSWHVGGDHGSDRGGRLYITAMATMILEVYYRHLPIYQTKAAEEDFPL